MKKLTEKQRKDLKIVKFFIPRCMKQLRITETNEIDFLRWSEKGKGERDDYEMSGLNALMQGKRWRGIHMEMYEDGVLSGDMPYSIILEGLPREVSDFIKVTMFKGIDSELIERIR